MRADNQGMDSSICASSTEIQNLEHGIVVDKRTVDLVMKSKHRVFEIVGCGGETMSNTDLPAALTFELARAYLSPMLPHTTMPILVRLASEFGSLSPTKIQRLSLLMEKPSANSFHNCKAFKLE